VQINVKPLISQEFLNQTLKQESFYQYHMLLKYFQLILLLLYTNFDSYQSNALKIGDVEISCLQ